MIYLGWAIIGVGALIISCSVVTRLRVQMRIHASPAAIPFYWALREAREREQLADIRNRFRRRAF